jgi:hypothetical protein
MRRSVRVQKHAASAIPSFQSVASAQAIGNEDSSFIFLNRQDF